MKAAHLFMWVTLLLYRCSAEPTEYDFIIVGGGTAGCLMAARLSEIPHWTVLLIEAGGEENVLQDVPMLPTLTQLTEANWGHKTEPSSTACLGMNDGRCNWPTGRVLGGTSVLNYMVYSRGNRKDYDGWEEQGCEGWGYNDILPYFLRSEDMLIPYLANDTVYHSTKGELPVNEPRYHSESATVFLKAASEIGYESVDYNGRSDMGFSYVQTMLKDGMRVSSNRAFLEPARKRNNLYVQKRSLVTKILIHKENQTAYGVQYTLWGLLPREARARKEVIVSAGAINSPQLLMLSGIGPKEDLQKLGISVIQDSKVGYNLQDHISLGNLFIIVNSSIVLRFDNIIDDVVSIFEYLLKRTGILADTGSIEALGFEDVGDHDDLPDIELLFAGTTLASLLPAWVAWGARLDIYNVYKSLGNQNAFSIFPTLMHPKSRGRITLRSAKPTDMPLIYHNYLTEPEDMDILIEGIHRTINLTETEAFQQYDAQLYTVPLPPCKDHEFASDAYWECSIRQLTFTTYHPCGTCKMGPNSDPDAVVDPKLKVRGIQGLRVVDASIIPTIPVGHLTAPIYMIAEKGADMIKKEWNLKQ
jgi:choline dehydrogenase-like flavoprotein